VQIPPGNRRQGCGRSLGREYCRGRGSDEDGHLAADQIGGQLRQPIAFVAFCEAVFDGHIAAFDIAHFAQAFAEGLGSSGARLS
jgi:hypothetical protein